MNVEFIESAGCSSVDDCTICMVGCLLYGNDCNQRHYWLNPVTIGQIRLRVLEEASIARSL
jgi:hypothetical protein